MTKSYLYSNDYSSGDHVSSQSSVCDVIWQAQELFCQQWFFLFARREFFTNCLTFEISRLLNVKVQISAQFILIGIPTICFSLPSFFFFSSIVIVQTSRNDNIFCKVWSLRVSDSTSSLSCTRPFRKGSILTKLMCSYCKANYFIIEQTPFQKRLKALFTELTIILRGIDKLSGVSTLFCILSEEGWL